MIEKDIKVINFSFYLDNILKKEYFTIKTKN